MKILSIDRTLYQGDRRYRTLANFDLELSDDVKIYGMRLLEGPSGKPLAYAPNANGGRRLATFAPSLAEQISAAAFAAYKGHVIADDQSAA